MAGAPYIFNEIERIIKNTPLYALALETFLLLSVIWLIFYKRNGRKRYTSEEEEAIILSFEPEALVAEVDKNHPALKPRMVSGKVGKYIVVNGYKCLNLSTHNYLGLLEDEKIIDDAVKSLRKYGVGSCGPRGFYGTVDVHLELEERLAKFMGTEEAVVYSYGFSTVASAIPAYSKRTDVIFVDEAVNFSIQKGLDASRSKIFFYKHNDMVDLERLLIEQQKRDLKVIFWLYQVIPWLIIMQIAEATLIITPIQTNKGYTTLNLGSVEIINNSQTILHIIDTRDLFSTIGMIEVNLQALQLENNTEISNEIFNIKSKLQAIVPLRRQKRGLINIIGTGQKWLFGTMDDNDRQDIIGHMNTTDTNNHAAIKNLNHQIQINEKFMDSINKFKKTIETDREVLSYTYQSIASNQKDIIRKQIITDQLLKLQILESKIDSILDNIASAKQGILHPSILTGEEIKTLGIDFYKLENA